MSYLPVTITTTTIPHYTVDIVLSLLCEHTHLLLLSWNVAIARSIDSQRALVLRSHIPKIADLFVHVQVRANHVLSGHMM